MKVCLKISGLTVLLFSSFYGIPQRCEAALAPMRIVLAVAAAGQQTCEAGVMDQLCSSVTNFLNEESAKADADVKACKNSCGWKKRKDDLLDTAKKKAKESCSKGEAPDANELSKGLDRNTKDRLKTLYDNNSRMFDGKAKLEAANFGAATSKDAAITGKGGNVLDLKSSEPAVPKIDSATEFSLTGKSNTLSASSVKTDGDPAAPVTSANTSAAAGAAAQKAGTASAPNATGGVVIPEIPGINIPAIPDIPDIPDPAWYEDRKDYCIMARSFPARIDAVKAALDSQYSRLDAQCKQALAGQPANVQVQIQGICNKALLDITNARSRMEAIKADNRRWMEQYCSGKGNWFTGLAKGIGNFLLGRKEKCGDSKYNPKKECCVDGAQVSQQACEAKVIAINGPSELILSKPAENSKPIALTFRGAPVDTCSCPKTKKIEWSLSYPYKVKFKGGAANQAIARLQAAAESEAKHDVDVTVTVDGVTSAPKKLTVKRPKQMSHPDLNPIYLAEPMYGGFFMGSLIKFPWTLIDHFNEPLGGAYVAERIDLNRSGLTERDLQEWPKNGIMTLTVMTNGVGQAEDRYYIILKGLDAPLSDLYVYQELNVGGYTGTSKITLAGHGIATEPGLPENPVELK